MEKRTIIDVARGFVLIGKLTGCEDIEGIKRILKPLIAEKDHRIAREVILNELSDAIESLYRAAKVVPSDKWDAFYERTEEIRKLITQLYINVNSGEFDPE